MKDVATIHWTRVQYFDDVFEVRIKRLDWWQGNPWAIELETIEFPEPEHRWDIALDRMAELKTAISGEKDPIGPYRTMLIVTDGSLSDAKKMVEHGLTKLRGAMRGKRWSVVQWEGWHRKED